jgi:hypothetical protein
VQRRVRVDEGQVLTLRRGEWDRHAVSSVIRYVAGGPAMHLRYRGGSSRRVWRRHYSRTRGRAANASTPHWRQRLECHLHTKNYGFSRRHLSTAQQFSYGAESEFELLEKL